MSNQYSDNVFRPVPSSAQPEISALQKGEFTCEFETIQNELEAIRCAAEEIQHMHEMMHYMLYRMYKVLVEGDFRPNTLDADLAAMYCGLSIPRRTNSKGWPFPFERYPRGGHNTRG